MLSNHLFSSLVNDIVEWRVGSYLHKEGSNPCQLSMDIVATVALLKSIRLLFLLLF